MKLSIITCTYNSEKYLQECIDSVIAQNLDKDAYEHIFVDAYSTDNTKKIIEKYKGKYQNVRIIYRKPKWIYNAMNEGIKESKWDYIMCLNSDDFLEKNILTKYLKFVKETWCKDIYYWKVRVFNSVDSYVNLNNLIKLRKFLYKNFGCNVLVNHPSTLTKKMLFEWDMWMFDETKKISSDYWFFLKCMTNKKEFCYFPEIITNFRIHSWGASSNKNLKSIANNEDLYFKKQYLPFFKVWIAVFIDRLANFCGKFIIK